MNHVGESPALSLAPQEPSSQGINWLQGSALILLIVLLYFHISAKLVAHWWTDPDFSHGFFVPLFSAFVIWHRRRRLAALTPEPSRSGLLVVVLALATLVAGTLGAELFLSRSSLVLLLGGLVIYFLGWRYLRAVFFPWVFLFLMVPLPKIIFNQVTFPLQFLASRLATSLLALVGVPVLREGNVVRLPIMALEVAEACSGIRSLLSLMTLAIIYGYFLESKVYRRGVLVIAAVPIAVVANGLRIMGTGLLGEYWSPEKAIGFFHEFSGWVIFLLSVGMLCVVQWLMRLGDRRQEVEET